MTHHTVYTSANYVVIIHGPTGLSQQHTSSSTKCVCVCVFVYISYTGTSILQGCRRFSRHRFWPAQKRKPSPRMSKWTRRWKQPPRYSGVPAPVVTHFALGLLPVGRSNPNALLGHETTRRVMSEGRARLGVNYFLLRRRTSFARVATGDEGSLFFVKGLLTFSHKHEDQREWHRMTRTTRPDCAVMCNLINTHTHTHKVLRTQVRIVQVERVCPLGRA